MVHPDRFERDGIRKHHDFAAIETHPDFTHMPRDHVPWVFADERPVADFVEKATLSDLYEITAADIARKRSTDDAVKAYARESKSYHSTQMEQRVSLARAAGAAMPSKLDSSDVNRVENLKLTLQPDFDQVYLNEEQSSLGEAIDLAQSYADSGTNPYLKAAAEQALPALKARVIRLEALLRSAKGPVGPINPPGSPSFDCSKAYTPSALTICRDASLSALDRTMASAFLARLSRAPDTVAFQADQLAWAAGRNQECGSDVACLRASMEARIASLNAG